MEIAILLLTFFVRALLWNSAPLLSTDVYRYLWDGNALLHGINPLGFSPNSPELTFLKTTIPLPPDHTDIPSIYPPLSLLYFLLITVIFAKPIAFCFGATFFDLCTVWLLIKLLKERRLNPLWSLLFALHPLSVIESGHNGHVEAVGVFFFTLALYFNETKKSFSPFFIAMTGLIKIWPASILLTQPKKARALLIFILPIFLLWIDAGNTSGISRFLKTWEFHSCVDSILQLLFTGEQAHRISFLLLGIIWAYFAYRPSPSLVENGFRFIGSFLLFSPTVHPWYALWLLPLLVIEFRAVWFYLTIAILSSYAVIPRYVTEGVWEEAAWPRLVTYGPVVAILSLHIGSRIRKELKRIKGGIRA